MPRALIFAAVALFVVLRTSPAQSQPAVEADALIERGLDARAHGRDSEALTDFTMAYRLDPSPRALAQMALAEQALGRWVEAERHLVDTVRTDQDPWIGKHLGALNQALEVIRDHLASVEVRCARPGAELWLNGAPVGTLPLSEQRVAVGPVRVEVRAPGFDDFRQTVSLEARQTLRIAPELTPTARSVGAPAGDPAAALASTAAALHPIGSSLASTAVPPLHRAEIAVASRRSVAWTLLGVGAALLAAAISAHVAHEVSLAHYNDDGSCFHGTLSRQQRCGDSLGQSEVEAAIAIAAYAGAAAAFGGAGYLFVTARPAPSGRSAERWETSAGAVWSF